VQPGIPPWRASRNLQFLSSSRGRVRGGGEDWKRLFVSEGSVILKTREGGTSLIMGRHKKVERKKELDRRRKRREKRLKERAKEAAAQRS